jgi:hypothetical protein
VELVSVKTTEVEIISDNGDEIGSSRMVLLYKTCKSLKREMFAQQRTVDVGMGIVRPNGKSRGRWGMPQVPHEVAESLWPSIEGQIRRTFVELWPTRMSPKHGWRMLDESC